MSVINKMLQELEQRKPGGVNNGGLPKQVRPAPMRPSGGKAPLRMAGVAVLALAVGGLAYWYRPVRPVGNPVVRQPAAAPQPTFNLPAPVSSQPIPPQPTPPEPAPLPAGQDFRLKMDSGDISGNLPAQQPEPSARAATPPPLPATTVESQNRRPSREEGAGKAPRKSVASASIAKARGDAQLKSTSPHQKAEFLYQKALSLMEEGRVAEARDNLDNALATEPGNAAARQLLAGVLIDGKKIPQAEAVLQAGLALTPEQAGLAMLLARLQVDQADLPGALATLRKTQPYAADNADYQAFMAALLQRAGQHEEAIERYRNALRRNPSSGPWLVGLGISLQAENRPADAQEAYGRAKSSGGLNAELQAFVDQRLKQIQR